MAETFSTRNDVSGAVVGNVIQANSIVVENRREPRLAPRSRRQTRPRPLCSGRTMLTGSHDEQCEGLRVLARLVGASGERPIRAEQSATDCRWTWSTVKRGERRVGSQDRRAQPR